ncbi:unnamed protein product, partial [Aureobasidium pullulans]
HTALGVQKLASFALVFSWSMVLRPSLPILRVILAFSVVSLLFRSLLFLYYAAIVFLWFLSNRVLYLPTTEGLHCCGILGTGVCWEIHGTEQGPVRRRDLSIFQTSWNEKSIGPFTLDIIFLSLKLKGLLFETRPRTSFSSSPSLQNYIFSYQHLIQSGLR